jgi:hypothetical protein
MNAGAGFGLAQLMWVDGDLPDVIEFEVLSTQWDIVEERISVPLPEVAS